MCVCVCGCLKFEINEVLENAVHYKKYQFTLCWHCSRSSWKMQIEISEEVVKGSVREGQMVVNYG